MDMKSRSRAALFALLAACSCSGIAADTQPPLDAKAIGEAGGTTATTAPDGVVRIAWARIDVVVSVDGAPLPPAAGLGSWAAFAAMADGAMVMGDTVLFEDEVDAAMDAAFAHGLEVTAIHNHFFHDTPKVTFMHLGGEGRAEQLAAGVKAVWDAARAVRKDHAKPATGFGGKTPVSGKIDAKALGAILGHELADNNGAPKVTIERSGKMHGTTVGGSMGLTTWAAFVGGDELASMDGDFIMTADEVQPVLRALRKAGVHVVALHSHMVGEQPSFYFTHFWGRGAAAELARGLRSGLDAQASAASDG